jgi:hypothetical protein
MIIHPDYLTKCLIKGIKNIFFLSNPKNDRKRKSNRKSNRR